MSELPIALPGFEDLSEILRNPIYVVYRGRRTRGNEPVLVKAPVRRPPHASEMEDLAREYSLLRSLGAPGVVRALELVREESRTHLVLEDRGLTPLSHLLESGRPDVAMALALGIQLCTTLGELHRRDLVHNGVSPQSILVDAGYASADLFDLGSARRSLADTHAIAAAVLSVGGAAYMSPEQTGRLNRSIDHRTDLYSLGATLYELLTGHPPFDAADPLELIHCHIAKTPASPASVVADVPEQVSRLVMRLLAKAAEDRYQSAAGVRQDLEACQREWAATRAVSLFELGLRDTWDRLLIPQRLYGRDEALLLVAGYSGVGKTSFIRELARPIAKQGGYFLTGKFDQVARNVPYGALIQALRGLVWLVLAESEEQLSRRQRDLSAALGNNGGVLTEVIPEIELVIGKQPAPPPLDPTEAQNRFRYVFGNFIGAFAEPDHPLVVFLDDLQWADAATLALLHALLTGHEQRHLLIIGAFRDNEVDAHHPLSLAIERLDAAGADVRRLTLGSLGSPHLVSFLSDTLRTDKAEVETLAHLIQQKTGGNPFFVIQFLKALHQDGLIAFDHESASWVYRTEAISAAGITDNVVALMTGRIQRLSARAQSVLRLAACIGSPFKWRTFLTASRQPPEDAGAGLTEALEAGLIEPAASRYAASESSSAGGSYAFLHDRVQQAAYALIPERERESAHLDVGRLLLAECRPDVPEDRLFEILNHLNIGSSLTGDAEHLPIARLNLAAGRKAKASAAYQAAWGYLQSATALLGDERWLSDYSLAFAVHLEAAECQYLAGYFNDAEQAFERLLGRAESALDKASVYRLKVIANENLSRYGEAVSSGREGLALFGISLPEGAQEIQLAIDAEMAAIRDRLGDRSIDSLIDLPMMDDATMTMVMRILTSVWAPAYIAGNDLLARLISATMVRLSLTHGNTGDSAYGYVTHAITVGPVKRDFHAAYEWGELALEVNERFADVKRRAKIHQQIHAHVKLWSRPFETCIPGAATESWPAFLVSRDLERFVRDHTPALDLLERISMSGFRDALQLILSWALALQGRTEGRCSLSCGQFDERAYLARYEAAAPLFLTFLHAAKLHLSVIMEDVALGVDAARRAHEVTITGTIWPVLADFWGALAMAAAYPTATADDQRAYRDEIAAREQPMRQLADSCPENFRCFSLVLSAELLRIDSRLEATRG